MSLAVKLLLCLFGAVLLFAVVVAMLSPEPPRQVVVNDPLKSQRLFMRQMNCPRKKHRRKCLQPQRDLARQLMAMNARLAASTQRLANCLGACA